MREDILARLKNMEDRKPGITKLAEHLDKHGFFDAPASTKFHSSFKGGLVEHSYKVYQLMSDMVKRLNILASDDTIFFCCILHDICKVGAYLRTDTGGYYWNSEQPKGHATLSIERIKLFVSMSSEEEDIIRYHMGLYGTKEFLGQDKGEYTLPELVDGWNRTKLAKLMHMCDDACNQWLER